MAKEAVGVADCKTCKREIPVKKSSGGALSLCCPWCDISKYAKPGTEAFAIEFGDVRRTGEPPGDAPAAASGSASAEGTLPKAEKAKKRRDSDPPAQVPAAASAATPAPASPPPEKKAGSIWDDLYGKKPA